MKKLFLFLIIILPGLLLFRCSIDEPVLPTWTSSFRIPLAPEKVIFREDLANDSTIVTSGDSLLISIDGDIDPETITSQDLMVEGQDSNTTFTLDTLRFDTLNAMSTGNVEITESLPFLGDSIGKPVFIPQTVLSANPKTIQSTEFRKAKILNGDIQVKFYNSLPVTLGPNPLSPQGIEVHIYNDSTNTLISDITIPDTLSPGETGIGTAPIGGAGSTWVYSKLRLEYSLPIAKDTVFVVSQQLIDTSHYEIGVALLDLEITEVKGRIDPQVQKRDWTVNWNEKDKIINAQISNGTIDLFINNHIPLSGNVEVRFPDIITPGGQPYQDHITIQADGVSSHTIHLDGYTIKNSQAPGSVLDSMTVDLIITTDGTDEQVLVKATDEIEVTMLTSDIYFTAIEGYLARDTLSIDPFEEHDLVDYNGFGSGFEFKGAQLLLEFENNIHIDSLLLDFTVTGYHKDDNGLITDSAQIDVTEMLQSGNGTDRIVVDGPQVDNFLNILPTDIRGGGSVVYSGLASVSAGDEIMGTYSFSTPFKIKIVDPDPVELDPDTLYKDDIEQDIRDAAGDDIKAAVLRANIKNHSPLGGTVRLIVSADPNHQDIYDTTAYFNPELEFVKTIQMQKAPVDPATGFVNESQLSQVEFSLNTRNLEVFKNSPIRIGMLLLLDETNQYVVLRGSDFVEISGEFEITVLFKDDK